MTRQDPELTHLLNELAVDKPAASDAIAPIVFTELHRLARRYMANERSQHTLQATGLVNEAFVNLVDKNISWESRSHFFAIAAKQMRRILVDYARQRAAQKRGETPQFTYLSESLLSDTNSHHEELIQVDELLEQLATKDPQNAQIFELKYFAGLTVSEISQIQNVSESTVEREIRFAKSWLAKRLELP